MADQLVEAPPEEQEQQIQPAPRRGMAGWPLWAWGALTAAGIVAGLVAVLALREATGSSYSGTPPGGGGLVLLPSANRGPGVTAGSPAPDFTLEGFQGNTVSLSDYRGQVVIVNFWATWCPPCRAEMPDIQQVYMERKDRGFTVLAVNIQEAKEPVSVFLNKYGISFPILMDFNAEVTQLYGVYGLPSTFFVDKEGRVTEVYVGALNKAAIAQRVDRLLD